MTKKTPNLEEIKELEERVAELTAGWQRTQADFINYRKVAQEEKTKIIKQANSDLIHDLLPVLDNFQLAAHHLPEHLQSDNWAQGIKQIEKQLHDLLKMEGLEEIGARDEQFNPEIHEAIEYIDSDLPEGEIVEVVMSGYAFNGELIRAAKVRVSKGKTKE